MIGFHFHDHSTCIADGIAAADAHCRAAGLQFTPVRRRVLELLLEAHKAMGAYDLLDILRTEGLGSQPPIVYRALDFLVTNGFAHKIERLNAFVACSHPTDQHAPLFMFCRICRTVAEVPSEVTHGRLGAAEDDAGFQIERVVMEAEGLCPNCQEDGAQ